MDAPIYLKKYTKEIDNLPGFKYQNWFSDLSWKGQLSIDDCSLFSVYFEGVLCEDGSIASTDKSPLRVYAKGKDTMKRLSYLMKNYMDTLHY